MTTGMPRFNGKDVNFSKRYDYFEYYMSHWGYVGTPKPIYKDSFEDGINNFINEASRSKNNLFPLEAEIKRMLSFQRDRSKIQVTGMLATQDAMRYTLKALEYSSKMMIKQVRVNE